MFTFWEPAMTSLDVRPGPAAGTAPPQPAGAELAHLLHLAGRGDAGAFLDFYDATVRVVHRYARMRYADAAAAERAVATVYRRAWDGAGGQVATGLSPLAWLLHDAQWP